MTPKEKAIELVEKFAIITDDYHRPSKQCALIAVDEIIKEIDDCDTEYCVATRETADETTLIVLRDRIKYWQEVEKEIKNL